MVPVRDKSGLDQCGSGGGREMWTDLERVMERSGFTETLAVGCEEKRIIKGNT